MAYKHAKLIDTYRIADGIKLRLYRSPIQGTNEYRFHFGFPAAMVEPSGPFLRSLEVVWKSKHWKRHNEYLIWSLPVTGPSPPRDELRRELRSRTDDYNRLAAMTTGSGSSR